MKQILFILLLFPCLLAAEDTLRLQDNVALHFFGLSFHPHGAIENAPFMPNKFDEDAKFVMNFGAVLSYEKFFYKDIFSVKFGQAFYADCTESFAGFSHIGFRARIFQISRHSLRGGIGPTLIFRRNWNRIEGTTDFQQFKGDKDAFWQYMFIWYGGEFIYSYHINEKFDCSLNFVPGYPDLMNLSIGVNYKL